MRKLFFLFFVALIVTFSNYLLSAQHGQIPTGQEGPPPTDPSCYSTSSGCTQWSPWSDWNLIEQQAPDDCFHNTCWYYAEYKTRFCISDPSKIEVWIGQEGVEIPYSGCPCTNASTYFKANIKAMRMMFYRLAIIQEFSTHHNITCQNGGYYDYLVTWPGTCTSDCIYTDGYGNNPTVTGPYACYPNGFCCAKIYRLCWDDVNNQIVENDIYLGGNPEDPNCGLPDHQNPNLCSFNYGNLILSQQSDCTSDCNYLTQ